MLMSTSNHAKGQMFIINRSKIRTTFYTTFVLVVNGPHMVNSRLVCRISLVLVSISLFKDFYVITITVTVGTYLDCQFQ